MNPTVRTVARILVQIAAGCFGVFFAAFTCAAVYLAVFSIGKNWLIEALIYIVLAIISGSLVVAAYQVLFHYSKTTVNNVAGFCGFATFGAIIAWLKPPWTVAHDAEALREIAVLLLPLLAGWFVYRVLREILFRLTIEMDK